MNNNNSSVEENWNDEEELKALGRVVHAFESYELESRVEIERWKKQYDNLQDRHKQYLRHIPGKCQLATEAVEVNQFFFKTMLTALDSEIETSPGTRPCLSDVEKVRYVLKNLVRDWSQEGKQEREACYGVIVKELKERFGDWKDWSKCPKVLVPGCGLGRLVVEIAATGFQTEGNEFSYFMLFPSSFMLNHSTTAEAWTIHPWVLSTCNQIADEDQLRAVRLPDLDPRSILGDSKGSMVMIAGDFVEVYARFENQESFDCVVTCFFIDTAHNVVEYLEIIYGVLKPGGVWINLGPLLYHWVDSENDVSIEISLQDIEKISEGKDHLVLLDDECGIIGNHKAMFQTVYNAVFWTMKKKLT